MTEPKATASRVSPVPYPLPTGLEIAVELWLVGVATASGSVGCRWPFAYGLARHADPDSMTVDAGRWVWEHHLRRDCGAEWYYPAVTASCRRLVRHGFLAPDPEVPDHWRLTLPAARRQGRAG